MFFMGYFKRQSLLIKANRQFYDLVKERDKTIQVLQVESNNFYRKAYNLYEQKKEELLDLNRKGNDKQTEQVLIYEINILAGVLNETSINHEDVASSLTIYPNSKY